MNAKSTPTGCVSGLAKRQLPTVLAAAQPVHIRPCQRLPCPAIGGKASRMTTLQHRAPSFQCGALPAAVEAGTVAGSAAPQAGQTLTIMVTHPSMPPNHTLCVVGSIDEVGNWQPEKGVQLKHVSGQLWAGDCVLPSQLEGTVQYKLVMLGPGGGSQTWEGGDNRKLTLPLPEAPEGHSSDASWHLLLHYGVPAATRLAHEQGHAAGSHGDDARPVPPSMDVRCVLQVPGMSLPEGQSLLMVGSAPEMGAWDVAQGVELQRAANPGCWEASLIVPAGLSSEVKLVTKDANGALHWETGPNRRLTVVDPAINPSISSQATGAVSYVTLLPDTRAAALPPLFFPTLPASGTTGRASGARKSSSSSSNGHVQQAKKEVAAPAVAAPAAPADARGQQERQQGAAAVAAVAEQRRKEQAGSGPQGAANQQALPRLLTTLLGSVSGQVSTTQLMDAVHAAAATDKQEAIHALMQLEQQLAMVKAELGVRPSTTPAAPSASPAAPATPAAAAAKPLSPATASSNGRSSSSGAAAAAAAEPEARKPAPQQQVVGRPQHGVHRKPSPSPIRPVGPPPPEMAPYESQVMGILAMYPNKRLPELQAMLTASTLEPRYHQSLEKLSALLNYLVAQGTITTNGFGQYRLRDIDIEVPAARRRSPSPRQRPVGAGFGANNAQLDSLLSNGSSSMRPPTPSPTRPPTPAPGRSPTSQSTSPQQEEPATSSAAKPKARGRPKREASTDTVTGSSSNGAAADAASRPQTPRPTRARKAAAGRSAQGSDTEGSSSPGASPEAVASKAKRRMWGGRGTMSRSPSEPHGSLRSALEDAAAQDARNVVASMPPGPGRTSAAQADDHAGANGSKAKSASSWFGSKV